MGWVDIFPVSDWDNQGWTPVGATTVTDAWDDVSDATYASTPDHLGWVEVAFPTDAVVLPEGGVITSVTCFARWNKTVSTPTAISVSVVAGDDDSRYRTRWIYQTDTITTDEVGTYTTDSLGQPWDVHRLNQFRLRFRGNQVIADAARVYQVFIRVNYKVRPTVTVTAPTGTVYTPLPVLSWEYSHAEGDAHASSEYKVFYTSATSLPDFDPNTDTPVMSGTVTGTTKRLVDPITSGDYTVYVRSTTVYGATSTWSRKDFTVYGPAPAIPGNDNAGATGIPGVGNPEVIGDNHSGSTRIIMRDASNLLSVQQADLDSDIDPLGYLPTGATLSRETEPTFTRGRGSLKVTSTSGGTVGATSNFIPITAEAPITGSVQVLAGTTSRTATVSLTFYTSMFATVGSPTSSSLADANNTWTQLSVQATAPETAAYVKLSVMFASTAASEVHYIDRIGVMYGNGSAWSSGGFLSRNLLDSVTATADELAGTSPDAPFIPANSATSVDRVAVTGTGADGSLMHRMTYDGTAPTIASEGAGTVFTDTASGTAFTLNAPATVADGDLMLAFVSTNVPSTIRPPTGWLVVSSTQAESNHQMYTLKRTFVTGDPASWNGSFDQASTRRVATVLGYSGAAPATEQFVAENVTSDPTGHLHHSAASLNATVGNTWRVAAFSSLDSAATTAQAFDQPPTVPPIQFVGRGTTWWTINYQTEYTITRPANVQAGDLMMAFVITEGTFAAVTPSGWTFVSATTHPSSPRALTITIMKKTATASEPDSWTETLVGGNLAEPILTNTVAYRNVKDASLQFIDDKMTGAHNTTSVTSTFAPVNTSSSAWRFTLGAGVWPQVAFPEQAGAPWTSTEVTRRSGEIQNEYVASGTSTMIMSFWDSDGPVETGPHIRQISTEKAFAGAIIWVALLKPLDAVVAGNAQTERAETTAGAGAEHLRQSVYDSNAPVTTGVGAIHATSTASGYSTLSWSGLIKPTDPSIEGYVSAKMSALVDISKVSPDVYRLADNKISASGYFLGSTAGTPYLGIEFYRGNQLISTVTNQGTSFTASTVWSQSGFTTDLPEGATRIRLLVAASDREVGDHVYFDRLSLAFGDSLVWRNGTGRAEHPIWSHPVIQYSDDDGSGYGEWKTLPGLALNPPEYDPLSGLVEFEDHTMVPLHRRKYRVQTVAYGLAGDVFASGFGPESEEVSLTMDNWWLKDVANPDNNLLLRVRGVEPIEVMTTNTSSVYQPMGRNLPVVVSDGYKGDMFELTLIVRSDEYAELSRLIKSNRTLFLQSNIDHSWWIRTDGNIRSQILATSRRTTEPLRFVYIRYVQVEGEE